MAAGEELSPRKRPRQRKATGFGPSGSQFSPAAVIELNWKDLGVDSAKLYYIEENGNYIEQTPDNIDFQGKTMMIQVNHFSRYALAWSN